MRPKATQHPTLPQGFSNTFEKRFWKKVNKTDSCWLWTGAKIYPSSSLSASGYGLIGKGGGGTGTIEAHVASWLLHNGPIPDGLWVLHKCDNPPCVRPGHIFLGTAVVNARDAMNKGRLASGEKHRSAKLTQDQVNLIRERYAAGGILQRQLAKDYSVSQGTVAMLINRRTWAHTKKAATQAPPPMPFDPPKSQ